MGEQPIDFNQIPDDGNSEKHENKFEKEVELLTDLLLENIEEIYTIEEVSQQGGYGLAKFVRSVKEEGIKEFADKNSGKFNSDINIKLLNLILQNLSNRNLQIAKTVYDQFTKYLREHLSFYSDQLFNEKDTKI